MQVFSDCPWCGEQNDRWVQGLRDAHVELVITCINCGCEFQTKGWFVYEEDERILITDGK